MYIDTIIPLETILFGFTFSDSSMTTIFGCGFPWIFPRLRQLLTQELAQNPSGRVGLPMWRD